MKCPFLLSYSVYIVSLMCPQAYKMPKRITLHWDKPT